MGALIDIVWVMGCCSCSLGEAEFLSPLALSITEGDLVAVYGFLEP